MDTNVGKQLSALGYTLTMLTGAADTPVNDGSRASQRSTLPAFMFDLSFDNKKRYKLIEQEMNEQAEMINDLKSMGASHGTIELEL